MNATRFLFLTMFAVALTAASTTTAGEPSQDEMMQAYMQAAQPGEQHEYLAGKVGTWNCTIRSWMDPSGDPMVSEGTEETRLILDGRFIESEFSGSMMGMPYEGRGVMGYDNAKQKFVGTWYDTMGTGIMSYEGEYDPRKKALVCHGSYVDPVTKQVQNSTLVSRELGPDRSIFEMWGPGPDGQNVKWMEIEYARAE